MNDISIPPASGVVASPAPASDRDAELLRTAESFEAVFIAQMLQLSGLAKAVSANGGFGGEAFASLLVEQYAAKLVKRGGFGISEKVYEQLRDKELPNAERTVA
jgi:Rod binding domain-containing protein